MASAPVLQGEAKAEPSPTKGEATSPTKVEKKEEDEAAKRLSALLEQMKLAESRHAAELEGKGGNGGKVGGFTGGWKGHL
eukprot:symbB.v1.2.009698.t1/scaffold594.1/size183492/5